ncbi:MAG: hypothetical protein ACREKJ_14490 [Candidatus Rokuibacteriota bacterium]
MPRDKRSKSLADGRVAAGRAGILPERPAEECPAMELRLLSRVPINGRVGPVTRKDA